MLQDESVASKASFVEDYLDLAYRYATQAARSNDDDYLSAAHDALLQVWQKLPGLQDPADIRRYLNTTVRSRVKDVLRAQKRRRRYEQQLPEKLPERLCWGDSDVTVADLLERLVDDANREIATMYYVRCLNISEIADAMGCSAATISRAMSDIRDTLVSLAEDVPFA